MTASRSDSLSGPQKNKKMVTGKAQREIAEIPKNYFQLNLDFSQHFSQYNQNAKKNSQTE